MGQLYFKIKADYDEVLKLRQEISKLKQELKNFHPDSREFGELNEKLHQSNERLKELVQKAALAGAELEKTKKTVDLNRASMEKYTGSFDEVKSSLAFLPGPIGEVANSLSEANSKMKALTTSTTKFIATPIGAAIAALAAALAALTSWFRRTEEGQDALNTTTAYFKQILDSVLDVADSVGEWLYNAFKKPKTALEDLVGFLKGQVINRLEAVGKVGAAIMKIFSGDISGGWNDFVNANLQFMTGIEDAGNRLNSFAEETNKKAEQRVKIAERQNQLDKDEREWLVKKAELEAKIAELREKAYNESIPEGQRAKAISEAAKLTNDLYDKEISLARERYEIIKDTNSLSNSDKQAKKEEAEALARLCYLEAQRSTTQRGLLRQSNRFSMVDNKEVEKQRQLKQKLAEEILSLEEKNQQALIYLMEDGSKKRLAQLDLDYQKEVQAIDKQREALAKEQGRELTDEESEAFNQAEELAFQKYQQGVRKEREQAAKEEQKAMDEYLAEYGRYFEKREAIQRQYEDKMKNAGTEGELLKLQEEQKKSLDELDETLMNDSELWSKYFSEFSSRSSASIRGIITDIEELIDYMNGVEGAEIPDIFKDNENTVKAITEAMSDPNALQKFTKGLNNQIKVFKKMLDKDNPFKMISDGFRNKDADSLAKGFEGIGQAASQLDSILRDLGVDSDSTLGKVTDALSKAASYASQGAQLGGAWGAAAGAALGIATSIVGSLGADYSSYNRLVEQYDSLIDVWDELIGRKKEYISMSWGDETLRAADEAIDLIGKETEAWKELGRARLNAGSSVGSHSIGVRMSKDMTDTDWQGIARALGTTVQKAQDMLNGAEVGGRMQGLFNLSAEQLKKLQEEAPAFWAKMDEDVRKYLQGIMDGVEQIEDVNKLAQEQLTQVSFDSMYDSFVSELMNMEGSAKDAAEDISQYFMQAMLSNRIGEMYREKLKSWYDKFANSMEGGLTTDEMSQLREEYLGYVKEALEERNTLAEITGYKTSFSQSASTKSWGSMSQETGEELNGRFTALQEYGSQINQKEDIKISQLNLINATMTEIRGLNVECRDIASDARDMMAEMFLEVREINENTGNTVKYLAGISRNVEEINRNTK